MKFESINSDLFTKVEINNMSSIYGGGMTIKTIQTDCGCSETCECSDCSDSESCTYEDNCNMQ